MNAQPQAAVVKMLAARALVLRPQQLPRITKAVELVLTGGVRPITDEVLTVASDTFPNLRYAVRVVEPGPWRCSCPDSTWHPARWCKHAVAAKLWLRALELGGDLPPVQEAPLAQRVHGAGHPGAAGGVG
jgi:hypothetical protein